MKTVLFVVAAAVVATLWAIEKSGTAALRTQVDAHHQLGHELAALRLERDRLRAQQAEADEAARQQRAAAEQERRRLATETPGQTQAPPAAVRGRVGEWQPAHDWQNRGCTTPDATIETLLWAAAGGDVEQVKAVVELEPAARVKLDAFLQQSPAATRALYPSPEHFFAAWTSKAVPLGESQIVWRQHYGDDQAAAFVWVNSPAVAPASPPSPVEPSDATGKAPPAGAPQPARKGASLALRRTDQGWRIVVPAHSVDYVFKQMRAAK